jgi:hypothetical protein
VGHSLFEDERREMLMLRLGRMNQTMGRLLKMKEDEYSGFMRVMFGLTSPSPVQDEKGEIEWVDQSLNESQQGAIKFALASREVALIHGPPGVSTPTSYCSKSCLLVRAECEICLTNDSSPASACWGVLRYLERGY